MSPRRAASGTGGGGGRIAITVLIVAIVAIGMLLIVRARPEPGSLDPRSNRDDGTRALVLLLEQQGAVVDVTRSAPRPGTDERVLLLADSLDAHERATLVDFVEAGGVAVVADPTSSLHGGRGLDAGGRHVESRLPELVGSAAAESSILNDECTIAALEDLRGVLVLDGVLFAVDAAAQHCLGDHEHAFVIRRDLGDGVVVGLGDSALFTNRLIRFGDNSGLAVALLAPEPGSRVAVLLGASVGKSAEDIGTGDETLADLVRPGVWMGLAQLALAFVVFALARGIRPGRPVDEPRPSPLAGSDAVRARGTMMQRARHHPRAGALLQSDLQRQLCDRYHLDRRASIEQIERAASDRDALPAGLVRRILTTQPTDGRALLDLSTRIAQVRETWESADNELTSATRGADR